MHGCGIYPGYAHVEKMLVVSETAAAFLGEHSYDF